MQHESGGLVSEARLAGKLQQAVSRSKLQAAITHARRVGPLEDPVQDLLLGE